MARFGCDHEEGNQGMLPSDTHGPSQTHMVCKDLHLGRPVNRGFQSQQRRMDVHQWAAADCNSSENELELQEGVPPGCVECVAGQ